MSSYIWIGLALVCGILIGFLFGRMHKSYDGVFKVNTTNPDKDVFTLELSCPIGEIPKKRQLIFKVNNCSQEKPFA